MIKNQIFKVTIVSAAAIILLCLILNSLIYVGPGPIYTSPVPSLLTPLIKLFFLLSVLGLIGSLVVWIRKSFFTVENIEKIKAAFPVSATIEKKENCSICGKELKSDWIVCPHCGKSISTKEVAVEEIIAVEEGSPAATSITEDTVLIDKGAVAEEVPAAEETTSVVEAITTEYIVVEDTGAVQDGVLPETVEDIFEDEIVIENKRNSPQRKNKKKRNTYEN